MLLASLNPSAVLITPEFWVGEKEVGLLGTICPGWVASADSLHSHFSLWEKLQAKGVFLGIELSHLEREVT